MAQVSKYRTVRTLWHGENGAVLLLCPRYYITFQYACQQLSEKFFHFFEAVYFLPRVALSAKIHEKNFSAFSATYLRQSAKSHVQYSKKGSSISTFFLICIFLHEKFDKKSSNLNIYKNGNSMYNIKAVGGTKPQRHAQPSLLYCEISIL